MKWPRLRDIFAFRPPVDAASLLPVDDDADAPVHEDEPTSPDALRWQKIRFDNTIRLWVSIPTYLTCAAMWIGGAMADLIPMTAVFSGYVVIEFVALTVFLNTRFSRAADFILSALDLIAMSSSIYFTGGAASPLYFIFFIPLIVHAFHRDWGIILFSGFGGVTTYGVAVLLSLREVNPAVITDLVARIVFMLVTVAIACLALNLLRGKDESDRRRLSRLRAISILTHRLNRACGSKDLAPLVAELAPDLASAIGGERSVEVRALFAVERASLQLAGPPRGYTVPAGGCPAFAGAKCVANPTADATLECHWEAPAKSRLCVPIAISEGEVFGVLSASSSEPEPFGDEERGFLVMVARAIALCAHRFQQMEELRRTVEMGSCVTAAYLAAAQSTRATLEAVVEGALTLVDADQASIFLWSEANQRLEAVLSRGERAADERGMSIESGVGIVGGCFDGREPRWTSNVQEDPVYRARQSAIKSLLAVPLQTIKGQVIGVMTVSRVANRSDFSDDEIAMAGTFAHRAAHAICSAEFREAATRGREPGHEQAA